VELEEGAGKTMKKKSPVTILPREPLTNKARRSIEQYVLIQGKKKGEYMYVLVKATLEAERMRRSDLYAWLEKQGLVWRSGYWQKTTNKEQSNAQ
jgi:hypothetical protein